MLPECHCNEFDYEVPQFNVVADEVEDFYERLKEFQEYFNPCFQRSESRKNFLRPKLSDFIHKKPFTFG